MSKSVRILIVAVWLINGLVCKVLDLMPRHEHIVAEILGTNYAHQLTILIGVSEILMAFWILSGFKPQLNAFIQIVIVMLMNILEVLLVPELLLWRRFNIVFAIAFISIVYITNFRLTPKSHTHAIIS